MSSPVAPIAGFATGAPGFISGNLISVRLVSASTGLAGSVGCGAIATFGAGTIGAMVGVADAATFEVGAEEGEGDALAACVGVTVALALALALADGVALRVGVALALGLTVGVAEADRGGVGVRVGEAVTVGVGVGVGVKVGVATGSAGGGTTTGAAGGAGGTGCTSFGAPPEGVTTVRLIVICLSPTLVC